MQISFRNIENTVLFTFCIGVGLRFSGSTLPFIQPISIVAFAVFLYIIVMGYLSNKTMSSINLIPSNIAMLFVFYLLITLMYTTSLNYGLSKIIILFFWIFSFSIMSSLIFKYFNNFLFFNSISLLVVLILFYYSFGSPLEILKHVYIFFRLKDDETNPNSYSRFLGFGVIAVLLLRPYLKNKNNFLFFAPILLVAVSYMFLSGSKGPLFALISSVIFYSFLQVKDFTKGGIIAAVVSLGIVFFLTTLNISQGINDFILQRFINYEGSLEGREERYEVVFKSFNKDAVDNLVGLLFGNGSGNFSYVFDHKDIRSYPHNIFLEIVYEYGIIGLILFIIMVIFPFIKGLKLGKPRHNYITKSLLVFWLYTLITSLVSSDISGNFLLFGISILLNYHLKSQIFYSKT